MIPKTDPSANHSPGRTAIITLVVLCVGIEVILQLGDRGVIGISRFRSLAYEYGGFWTGLLGSWKPNYSIQPWLMFVTYGFLHAGLWHLCLNMITLVSLSLPVAARVGGASLVLLYCLSMLGGGIGFALLSDSYRPMVGASGALFGLAGAILAWEYVDRFTLQERRNIAIRRLGTPEVVVGPAGIEFVRIEPGTFTIGRFQPACPEYDTVAGWTPSDYERCEALVARDARPGVTATIDQPFYMGRYEITQAQWQRVMGTNPSLFQGNRVDGDSGMHPVDQVTWADAQAFIQRLNLLDPEASYRLPSELEWEYAARAGDHTARSWADLRAQAWISNTDKGTTHPVGQKTPNAWGFYDMLGNVWEWVEDYYDGAPHLSPESPATGTVRVLRGGSFLSDVKNATPFSRAAGPGNGFDVGFRVIRDAR